jgi:hypothetical protein
MQLWGVGRVEKECLPALCFVLGQCTDAALSFCFACLLARSLALFVILLFHIISARPSKQPLMVRTFLKVHTRFRLAYALRCRGY